MRKMIIIAMTMLMAISLHAQQPANHQQDLQKAYDLGKRLVEKAKE